MNRRVQQSRRRGPDRGSIVIFYAATFPMIMAMIGFGYDSSMHTLARQHATNIAREAARAGGQAIDFTTAVPGGTKRVDPAAAIATVNAYLAAAGMPPCTPASCVISPDQQQVTVTVSITEPTWLLQIIGKDDYTVTGTSTAQVVVG